MTDAGRVPLAARAWIADGVTGALVTADGTIDWYCPGRYDAPAALSRLLDPAGGAVRVGPVRTGTGVRRRLPPGTQRYRQATMVVETEMAAAEGRLLLTDLMPWLGPGLTPPGRIVRIATAMAGPVDVEIEVIPGWAWGRARRVSAWSDGLVADRMVVRCGLAMEADPLGRDEPRWRGVRRLDDGESLVVTIDDGHAAGHGPLSVDRALRLADDTASAWRSWLAPVVYGGKEQAAVERACLTVRALTFNDTGGTVAAGTTSLPRRAGGERTSDDRSVRWRDAAATTRTLARVGLNEDAEAAERWMREAADRARLPWAPVLDVETDDVAELEELPLAGWRRSQPVVTGSTPGLVDIDLYGDVLGAVSASRKGPLGEGGDGPLVGSWPALADAADWVADHWQEPDAGVWGSKGPAVRLVASAVQAWAALDRAARVAQAANPLDLAAPVWRDEAKRVQRWLESDGLAADGGLRRDPSPAEHPDAALLRVAWRGPWPSGHPIVERTVRRIIEQLASGLLIHRLPTDVDDGRAGADSPDLLASLWAAKALACTGHWEEAHERFDAVVALGGDLGLLSDAADPISGELLGNLPATAVHLAVIDTAIALERGPL